MVWTRRNTLPRISALLGSCSKTNELDVDHVEALVGFDQEFLQQVVHRPAAFARGTLAP
jgi:hypothetical protein